jgi:hypothetical protein
MSVLCPVLVLHSPEYQNATELRFSQQNTNEVDNTKWFLQHSNEKLNI